MAINHQGIIEPPVDRLLSKADSKYGLVIFASRRARQVNAYYSQLHEGLFEYVGPLVEVGLNEKSLSVALREIDEGLIESSTVENVGFSENGQITQGRDLSVEDFYTDYFGQENGDSDSAMVFSDNPEDQEAAPEGEAAVDAVTETAPEIEVAAATEAVPEAEATVEIEPEVEVAEETTPETEAAEEQAEEPSDEPSEN